MAQLLIPHPVEPRVRPRPGDVVEMVSPAPRDIWRGVLRDDPGSTALQTPEYFDAVVLAAGGTDVSRFYQLRDGRQLVLPLVRQRSRAGRSLDAGYPDGYGDGGMIATGGLLADDVRTVVQDLRGHSAVLRIGSSHHTSEQWSAGLLPGMTDEWRPADVVELGSPVAGDVHAYRATRLDARTQVQLRHAVRLGVEIETVTGDRLIPSFYDVYRAWVERAVPGSRAVPVPARRTEPYDMFAAVAAMTGEACRVLVAWYRGRPIAALILLVHGQHAVVWRSYSIRELATPMTAGLLLHVTAIEDAISSGCRFIDLGPSGDVDKSSLGASRRSVVDLRREPAGLARLRAVRKRAGGGLVRALTWPPGGSIAGQPTP